MTFHGKLLFLTALAGFLGSSAAAQDYKIKAAVEAVPATGFYKIPVTPEVTAWAKADLTDIRLTDSNIYVPYISHKEAHAYRDRSFTQFKTLSNITDGNYTLVELENTLPNGITNLSLIIRNTAVERYTAISGSDDRKKWYIIDDSISFRKADGDNDGNFVQTLYFPLSKYKYIKLKINNAHTDPLSILKCGVFRNEDITVPPGYMTNPAPTITQKDSSNNTTYVIIRNNAPYLVNKLLIDVAGPKFYKRNVTAYILANDKDSSGLYTPAAYFCIATGTPAFCDLNTQKAATIILQIENRDNPPLKITKAATSQEMQYLVAWLEQGQNYTLLAGNPAATAPAYDLAQFKDSIPATLTVLATGPIQLISKATVPEAQPKKNYWLWPSIIGATLLLGLLTFRLVKDMNKTGGE